MAPKREDVQQLATALFTVQEGLAKAVRRLKNASLLRLLQTIAGTEPVRPSELAAHLEVHQSLITRQIKDLEAEGKVEVSPDPHDGRAFVVSLTETGRAEVAELAETGLRRFMGFVQGWETEDVREFTRLLWKFQESKAEFGAANPAEPAEVPAAPVGASRRGRTRTR
ncbi:MAG TPA: MarR family winged helix-turn-helix transcriptional regulator [Pseudonocardiaceae bacterium]|jgi:DNA-binding MarR family transcriptional regulator|nr:MarR family winged helix-turn-helix transcriptional regulator [Pseudonocardiaceae bacterium]